VLVCVGINRCGWAWVECQHCFHLQLHPDTPTPKTLLQSLSKFLFMFTDRLINELFYQIIFLPMLCGTLWHTYNEN
jgi:hypothetical protein